MHTYPSEMTGVLATKAFPPACSTSSTKMSASSLTRLLQGLAFVQGAPMVMMGLWKSASCQPVALSGREGGRGGREGREGG